MQFKQNKNDIKQGLQQDQKSGGGKLWCEKISTAYDDVESGELAQKLAKRLKCNKLWKTNFDKMCPANTCTPAKRRSNTYEKSCFSDCIYVSSLRKLVPPPSYQRYAGINWSTGVKIKCFGGRGGCTLVGPTLFIYLFGTAGCKKWKQQFFSNVFWTDF